MMQPRMSCGSHIDEYHHASEGTDGVHLLATEIECNRSDMLVTFPRVHCG
jgi:hypothetical protein